MIDQIKSKIKQSGIKDFEIYFQEPRSYQLFIRRNELEMIQRNERKGASLRIHDGGLGFSVTNIFSEEGIESMIKNAHSMARIGKKVDFEFPSGNKISNVKTVDEKLKYENSEESINDYFKQILQSAKENKVEISFGKLKAFDIKTTILNNNFEKERWDTFFRIELSLKPNGNEFWVNRFSRSLDDIPLSKIEEWMKISKRSLHKAEEPETEKTTILFNPDTIVDALVPVLSYHSSASSKKKKTTIFEQGKLCTPTNISITDEGTHPFALQTHSFDDEGVAQNSKPIIEKGIFKNFVSDQFFAKALGESSTGNGLRQRFSLYLIDDKYLTLPENQTTNLIIHPGTQTLKKLISEIKKGIIKYMSSWLHPYEASDSFGTEIRNADFIENGEITGPVKGGVVSGNVFDMLKNVSGISKEIEVASGGTAISGIMPYMRIENVQVAGK